MYYNQNNYPNTPYPSKANPNATIQSGGCGVCCGSTILSLFGNDDYPPPVLARLYRDRGARVDTGTDMRKAIQIICELGGLTYSTSSSEVELVMHLRSGGLAIANVDGDVGETGIFSKQGHYICVIGMRDDGLLEIFDVGDYPTKYNSAYRAKHVKRSGPLLLCTTSTLDIDTKHRTPNYYLLKKKEDEEMFTYEQFVEYQNRYEQERAAKEAASWAETSWIKATLTKLFDGSRPFAPLTRQEAALTYDRLGLLDPLTGGNQNGSDE